MTGPILYTSSATMYEHELCDSPSRSPKERGPPGEATTYAALDQNTP